MFPSPVIISPEQEDVYRRFKTLRDWFELKKRHDVSRRFETRPLSVVSRLFMTIPDDSVVLVTY